MEKITFVNESEPYVSAENLNQMQTNVENAINEKISRIKFNTITGLSLEAGATYQLTLPENRIFIEPLLSGKGSDTSGGQFLVVGTGYNYISSTDISTGGYHGMWVKCDSSGLFTISSYNHCGAKVAGFRIWYYE